MDASPIAHRLFASVVAGGVLLACGETAPTEPSGPTPDRNDATTGGDSGRVDSGPEDGGVVDAGSGVRLCERGFAPTKGCSFPAPNVVCCDAACCELAPDQIPDGGHEVDGAP